jgi:hypothetical protein
MLLAQPKEGRRAWLAQRAGGAGATIALLTPVLERFETQVVEDLDSALAWCRQYATTVSAE